MGKSRTQPRPNKTQPPSKPALRRGEEIDAEETFLPLLAIAGLWGASRAGRRRWGAGGSGYGAGYGSGWGSFGMPGYGTGFGSGWGHFGAPGYGAGYGSGWGGFGARRFPFIF